MAMDTKSWSVNTFSWLCHSGPNRFKLNASLSVQPSCFISLRTSSIITFQFHHFIPGTAPTPSIQTAFSWSKHESWSLLCKSRRALASCRQVLVPTATSRRRYTFAKCKTQSHQFVPSQPILLQLWAVQETLLLGSAVLLLFRRCALWSSLRSAAADVPQLHVSDMVGHTDR